jgi:microcystin-dependent protein
MTPYLGQITLVAFNFAPVGWALCNGQLLQIAENDALFALIGTTYGGDGQTTFALPNLQSRIPIHQGQGIGTSNYVLGQNSGSENVSLTVAQIPNHGHTAQCLSASSNSQSPVGAIWGLAATDKAYQSAEVGAGTMAAGAIGPAGGNQPHPNLMPYQALNYIIALEGVFPSQS